MGTQRDLTTALSRLSSELWQQEAQVQKLQEELRQAEACEKLITSRLELAREEESPVVATARGDIARLREEEAQAASRLAHLERDLASVETRHTSSRADAQEHRSQVADAESWLQSAKARHEERFNAMESAGMRLRAETESASKVAEEVNAAHQTLADAGNRSHVEQAILDKLRAELAMQSGLRAKHVHHAMPALRSYAQCVLH